MTNPSVFAQPFKPASPTRRDTIPNLLDAHCSNRPAQLVVQLTLSPTFTPQLSALYPAIDRAFPVQCEGSDLRPDRPAGAAGAGGDPAAAARWRPLALGH
ncbi:hypothetical protein [Rubidibacter lacunae]|uniref:hypothetical protein n=1 Tax=Rubidibacter lacunae TaxID=582514 RepID=UPI00058D4933|nr:hypothetical protein [Rubidibacter lacunae]